MLDTWKWHLGGGTIEQVEQAIVEAVWAPIRAKLGD